MKITSDKESVIRSCEIQNEGISYNYSLTERRSGAIPSYGLSLYTVKVKMKDASGISTEAVAGDIFKDEACALNFYDKIVRNLAIPIDLAYVVEDELK